MRLRRWMKLALLLVAAGANALVVAAPAHVFAATPAWSASFHEHPDCCAPAPQCTSSCAVTPQCGPTAVALPASLCPLALAPHRAGRVTLQSLLPNTDALSIEAPPPRS
jgi:hypothetical protein